MINGMSKAHAKEPRKQGRSVFIKSTCTCKRVAPP